jgi:hypothetical protein
MTIHPQKTNSVHPTVIQYKLQFGVIFQENQKEKEKRGRLREYIIFYAQNENISSNFATI